MAKKPVGPGRVVPKKGSTPGDSSRAVAVVVLVIAVVAFRELSVSDSSETATGNDSDSAPDAQSNGAAKSSKPLAPAARLRYDVHLNLSLPNFDETASAHAGVVVFPQLFTEKECDRIEKARVLGRQDATIGGQSQHTKGDYRRGSLGTLDSNARETQWIYKRISAAVETANKALFKFEQISANFKDHNMYERVQIAEYPERVQGHYQWHHDDGAGEGALRTGVAHRRLSLSVILSDNKTYDGGELQFATSCNVVPFDLLSAGESYETLIPHSGRGSAVIFSSCLNHRVTPVVRGLRKSLVQWVRSPEPRPRSSAEVWNAVREAQIALEKSAMLFASDRQGALNLVELGIVGYGEAIRDHPSTVFLVDELQRTLGSLHLRHKLPDHLLELARPLGVAFK